MHCSLHYNISKLNAMTDNMFALLVFGFNVLAGSLISTVVCQSTENSTEADDSYLIWTSFNPSDSTSKILSLPADLEKVHMEQKYQILEESNPGASVEYWALAGNYEKNILFYTDYKSEQIELLDIEEHKSKSIFQGIAHGIESLAYDWVTENLYWIDVRFNWIVTSEKTFNYFTPIYRSDQKLFALTLHAKRRKLYFSTYKSMGCGIMVTDLAGRGEETLFEFPANCSVCGITVDYTDERLYWTDYYGAGSRILSSNLDGSDKKQHGEKHFMAVLWDVTVYKNNIYVTDCHSYEPEHRTTGYRIWSVSKTTNTSKFKTYNERPRRITVLSKNENRPSLNVSAIGECDSQPKCDHICLPRLNATRECVCALGYYKQGDTQCKEQLIDDEFMYVVDKNQGKIFQISLNGSNNENWNLSIVPVTNFTDKVEKVNHIATDIETGYLYWYWSNPRQTTLSRSLPNKTQKEDLQRYKHVDNLIVDPRTKNVYFVGSDTKVIYVLSPNGTYEAELVNNLAKDVKIKDIALDSVNRKIYWTAIHNEYVDQGEVWRMNLNGLGRELVMDKLYWPSAIHVDQESSSLFVGEVEYGIVTQVPLDLLRDVTNTSWESVAKRYNVFKFKNTTSNESYYILDIKVHKGRFFFVEDITRRIYAFNLSGGIDNLMPFGPNVFYKPSSLAIYSQLFHKSYIENIPSPCQERPTPCPHICVDLSDTSSQCLCQTHFFLKGEKCVDYTQTSNSPPFINLNCGKVDNVPADDCKDFATMSWPDFKWTDDWTPTEKLKVVTPKLPKTLKVDSYLYHLRATDEHEQMTECSFSIRVYQNLCHNYPKLPNGMIKSNQTCGKQAGSKYNITCKNPKEVIYFDYHAKDTILNVCHQGSWSTQNLNGAYCLNPAAAATENIRIFNVTTG
ncbi:vitellogenin receptor-like [Clavelina lepadiformis]|uniref:vitellogenin receptor-like n=1 Tax=Clavelina lepadiformis TaxID=159417 RepID=UPI0040432FD1